ncbi:DUF2637 domain-containing protein [Streptomyces sioyaensis]|uniref:DUF2637 domain-containing protein n=1 Tax=Streptomyces sioyaensis TaxID=67364 RepID=UPI00379B4A5E
MTAVFAYCAFRLSFVALTDLAAAHGVAADIVWMFAVLVDGGAVVGTVGVVVAKRNGRPTRAYWATVVGFATTSLGFNVAHSDGTAAGIAIAITPPAAQLVATELLVRMLPAPDVGTATVGGVAPLVAVAEDAAARAESAARTVAEAVRAAAARAAAVEANAAAERFAQVSSGDTVGGVPVEQLDLAALVAAADDEVPFTAADTDTAPPAPLPHSATFAAPPSPAREDDAAADDAAVLDDVEVPPEWVAAYRRIERASGKRPTAERLGAEFGLKRTRGSEIREQVEAHLEQVAIR